MCSKYRQGSRSGKPKLRRLTTVGEALTQVATETESAVNRSIITQVAVGPTCEAKHAHGNDEGEGELHVER
jgi:hypothetical protein